MNCQCVNSYSNVSVPFAPEMNSEMAHCLMGCINELAKMLFEQQKLNKELEEKLTCVDAKADYGKERWEKKDQQDVSEAEAMKTLRNSFGV